MGMIASLKECKQAGTPALQRVLIKNVPSPNSQHEPISMNQNEEAKGALGVSPNARV
jgi:hypothetical protein